ncbi:MAG: hypothetical protein ACYDAY_03090 [Candidatus Dormibacteria bacterium]
MAIENHYSLRLRTGDREIEVSGDHDWVQGFWEDPQVRDLFLERQARVSIVDSTQLTREPDSAPVRPTAGAARRRAAGAGSPSRKRRVQQLIQPPPVADRYTSAIRASADHKARVFLSLLLARELYKLEGLSMAEILQVLNGRCQLKLHRSSLDASLKRVEGGFEKIRPRWSNQVRLYRLTESGEEEALRFLQVAETPVPSASEAAGFGAQPFLVAD